MKCVNIHATEHNFFAHSLLELFKWRTMLKISMWKQKSIVDSVKMPKTSAY